MSISESTRQNYIAQRQKEIAAENKKKEPNRHLIAVLEMHINMAKDTNFTNTYGLVGSDSHGEFAKAYFLGF